MKQAPFVAKRPVGNSPWIEFGSSKEQYLRWAPEVCSIACVRSLILWRSGVAPSLWELTELALGFGVFQISEDSILGAYHYPLSRLLASFGFDAEVKRDIKDEELWDTVENATVMLSIDLDRASVGYSGSHLILVTDRLQISGREYYCIMDSAQLVGNDSLMKNVVLIDRSVLRGISNHKGLVVRFF